MLRHELLVKAVEVPGSSLVPPPVVLSEYCKMTTRVLTKRMVSQVRSGSVIKEQSSMETLCVEVSHVLV